jgi:hypothetical protein
MARLRFLLLAALALVMIGCTLPPQENYISFTWDGMQYTFTASDDDSGNPYAVGRYSGANPPYRYIIQGSATAADAAYGYNTIVIDIIKSSGPEWGATVYFSDSVGDTTTFYLGTIPEGMIDSLITNRDAPGQQFAGAMPGPFQGGETPILENVIFSVYRLPDEIQIAE